MISLRSAVVQLAAGSAVLFILLAAVDQSESTTGSVGGSARPSKLQIGIKKRIDNCEIKSKKGDLLHIHYSGRLAKDDTEFDSSYTNDRPPLTFTLGAGQVIKGWDQGLLGMCEGEKRKLVIPSELGYGSSGAPPKIPADAVLIFETELIRIERRNLAGEL